MSNALLRAADEWIDREDAADLLRRLIYGRLEITPWLSKEQLAEVVDEACETIRDRATELSSPEALREVAREDAAESLGDYERDGGKIA